MPGFIGNYNAEKKIAEINVIEGTVVESLSSMGLHLQTRTINKFMNDKLCYEDNDLIVIIEGVILNRIQLIEKYRVQNFTELVKLLYETIGEVFYNNFRGSFSGLLFDKKKQELIIFTDHIGDKAVFYSQDKNQLYFGSELKYITELFKENNINYSLDMAAAYSALTYGYMLADLTYIERVKRLRGGMYLVYNTKDNKLEVKQYHQFDYRPDYSLSDKQIIERVDNLFSQAVKNQLDKNREYNYDDFAALSAGLDSRMTTFALSKIKKSTINSFTYSPIDFYDQKTSAAIVKLLKNDYVFQSHYSGELLLQIDKSIEVGEGLYMYFGAAVLRDFFKKLNTNNIGLIHSGQIGDVILGCFSENKNDRFKNLYKVDMHSKLLADRFYKLFDFENYIKEFSDREIYSIYNRGFRGVNSASPLVFQQFTETVSPFCDVEFCEFCLTIPIEKRLNNYIYDQWILKKYPLAAKFNHNGTRKIGGKMNNINELSERILRKTSKFLGLWNNNTIRSVTPINIWSNKEDVKNGLQDYFENNISVLNQYPELQNDCKLMFEKGTVLEKNQVLTLIGSVKLLFN